MSLNMLSNITLSIAVILSQINLKPLIIQAFLLFLYIKYLMFFRSFLVTKIKHEF